MLTSVNHEGTSRRTVVTRLVSRIRNVLPEGRPLPDQLWRRRHRGILILLWLHTLGIVGFGLIAGDGLAHSLAHGATIAAFASLAAWERLGRTLRAVLASCGLITASAVLVHLSGGYIELHFHFFAMLPIIALYQEWTPFLLAIGYVALHHGLMGTLAPVSVYNHPAAWAHPWRWGIIHAVFVLGASVATVVNWRLIEAAHARAEDQQARARRLHTLTRLNQLISASLDMDHLLREIAQAAATLMHAPLVGFFIADEAAHTLEVRAFSDGAIGAAVPLETLRFGEGAVGWVATQRRPLHIPDIVADDRSVGRDWVHAHDLRSFLGVPVLLEERLLAVLALHGRQPFEVGPEEQVLLDNFVAQAAVAIRNASLYAAEADARAAAEVEITERRRAEAELTEAVAQLERSNRELQDFAYVASHDLQEPLRKIRAFGDRLTTQYREALGTRGRDYLERMQQAAARMQTLITDLLTFSRVTTKAQPFGPVDLTRVAQEVIGDLEVRLEQVGGRVAVEALPTIEADPLQMRQLLQNLLGNALKFHRPETPTVVKISSDSLPMPAADATEPTAPPPWCQLVVEDNGIGFDEKYLDRIFAPFQRLHGRSEYEGTGIGLAICRKIAERHGGCITAHSTPGQGATFVVTLPVTHAKGERTP
jgi:signal transduction histidine kinase